MAFESLSEKLSAAFKRLRRDVYKRQAKKSNAPGRGAPSR